VRRIAGRAEAQCQAAGKGKPVRRVGRERRRL